MLAVFLWRFQQDIKDIHRHIGITPHEIRYQLQQSNLQVALIEQEIKLTQQYDIKNSKSALLNRIEQLKYRLDNIRVVWNKLQSDLDKTSLKEELNRFEDKINQLKVNIQTANLHDKDQLNQLNILIMQIKINSAAMYSHGSDYIRLHTDRYVSKLSRINQAINTLIVIFILLLAVLSYALTLIFKQKTNLNKLSIEDPLTGLFNRRQFNDHMSLAVNNYHAQQTNFALMVFDIDYFKLFNDQLGHIAGDKALQAIAQHLTALKKQFPKVEFYRVGGEEFACLCYFQDYRYAKDFAETIRASIEDLKITHSTSKVSSYITVSIGIAYAAMQVELTSDSLYSTADQALYKAKKKGRNQICFYQNESS
ncbi:hypothetical protein THO17_13530 [Marinomonas sp. THO17]